MSGLDLDRTDASWVAFARIFVGVFWLYEVFIGGRWKLGTPASGYNPDWVGAAAGGEIAEEAQAGIADGTWVWTVYLIETVVLPYADVWANLVTVSQLLFGVCMILGAFTRLVSVGAILQLALVVHMGPAGIGPIVIVGHLFALATDAGQYYGVDGWLTRRSGGPIGGALERLATLGTIPSRALPVLAAGSAIAGLYYLLTAVEHTGDAIAEASLEIGVLFGLGTLAFGMAHYGVSRLSIGAEIVRLFVGYRLFHEIFLSTDPSLDRMPGWASPAGLAGTFEQVVANHFAVVGAIVEAVFIPAAAVWAFVFAVVQTAVAAALLAGWRTRTASAVGIAYSGLLILLGFTRYVPFVLGLLVIAWALAGRSLALDADGSADRSPRLGSWIAPASAAVAIVAGSTVPILGASIAPDGYVGTMGGVVAAMVAIFALLIGWTALAQRVPDAAHGSPAAEPTD